MMIQLSGSPGSYSYVDIRKFLKFLFSKVSFKDLKCLMLCGIEFSNDFSQEIGALNLNVFHMRNFRHCSSSACFNFFEHCNSLKTLYIVHPDRHERVCPPKELKKLVIYCPKSSKHMIEGRKATYIGLSIDVDQCHALKEM